MDIEVLLKKKKNIKSSITKLQNKTEEEIEKLNNVGLLARKNRFLEFRTEIKDILDSIISICEEKDEETYCTEKDDILDTLEEILVAIDTQLMPSAVNSDFEVKNQGSSHSLVSARSAEVKLPTLSLPIFSGVTEEWLAFSDLFEAAVSNNNDLTGAQKCHPKLDELLQFLATQARSITNSTTKRNVQRKVTLVASNAQSQCLLCNGDHTLSRCDTFLKLSVQGRSDFVKTNNVCFNCLTQFHSVKTCKSKFRCKKCKKPHHSLLHFENVSAKGRQGAVNVLNSRELSINAPVFSPVPISGTSEPSENSRVVDVTSCISDVNPDVQILLCTALIQVRDIWGNYQTCRCLLDSGSQASLITNECIERLGLRKEKANVRISCLGASDTRLNGLAEIQFTSHFSSQNSFHASVYVINKIVGMIPHHDLDSSMRELFGDISLADPAFYKSSPIDVLLGVDLTLPLLKGQTLSLGKDKPFAIRSELGWIIGGKANSSGQNSFHVNHIQLVSDQLINKFWELDSVPCAKPLTSLEEACEDHFVKTHSRDENGRYTVKVAISHSTDAVRDTSCTTKLRVVFDASSKTSSGLSLNDLLMVGPRVQPELFPILIQFRIFSVAICADVEKMFRQIKVHEEDVDWQRILWRDSPTEPIREYRLTTVTYGTSSAPFLSTRTLRQLAIDEQENYPAASRATLSHFYVDDLLSGSATKKGAIQLVSELQEMMKRGGFSLRKWVSNDPDVLATIPKELKAVDSKHTIKDDQPVKILGIAWLPDVDKFTFTITVNETDVWTKRKVLSEVAKIFDPLGWLAPSVVISKIFLQELWSHHLSWDEELPDSLARQWRTFQEQLPLLTNIKIPRCILISQAIDVQVHGFCDSSEKAYCAVIYIRSKDATQTVVSRLLTSKTRVSPVKPQSLPRLELCSALLLANLLQATLPTLTLPISETFAWSDSKITLAWLKSDPRRWQPFVANRVAQIQELTPNVHWNFVSGLENPADCGTRGIPPTKLEKCNLWFNGPDWLRSSTFPIGEFEDNPQLQEHMSAEAKRTSKLIMLNVVDATFKAEFFQKFSSWNKLKRVVAYCLRFVKNCSLSACKRRKSFLTTAELSEAEKGIVKFIQRDHFSMEVSYLSAGKQLPSTNKLIPLTPFYDDSGIIRVGGRLKNSILADSQKHPILLPKTDHVVNLIISDYHLKLLHAGPQLLQAALREKFWILSARDAVRRVSLPSSVFQRTGIDFAGPFLIRSSKGRGSRNTKCYICVFVCLATKAVHLEVVSDLTSKAFIACLKRFVARRGKPSEIFCDQGTNFYGASRDLRKEFRQLMKEDAVHQFLVTDNITFHFNPPSAPHFGGIWEATVKSFKFHLNRVVGVTSLTFEELSTLSSQIEACLNSRPLCVLSSSPDDPCVLTPGHFLIGKALTAIPQPTVPDDLRHCDRWRLLTRMTQHFWNRWSSEYLTLLQSRSKWRIVQKNLDIGDLVLIKHDNSPHYSGN
ncbi:integrase catalytic domain-containing protein [Trichonephila clavipes]|nr:integrase catalytic domain-containing protein [Trichonephila clavipes]